MKNKIMVMMYSVLLAVSVLGFTDPVQGPNPNVLMQKRADEKVTFDNHQAIYNDKANTDFRADALVDKDKKMDDQEKQKVEETEDKTKGQFLWKF